MKLEVSPHHAACPRLRVAGKEGDSFTKVPVEAPNYLEKREEVDAKIFYCQLL